MDTVFATDASQSWRGIEFELKLLKKGLIWRVGNGKSIQVQRDQWIPRNEGLKVASFTCRSRIRWVNQLIDPISKTWNQGLIHRIFSVFDATEILKIKIPQGKVEDCVAWHYERNGVFTVRSAYKLAMLEKGSGPQTSSSSASVNDRSIWDAIWKAKVPEKIKITICVEGSHQHPGNQSKQINADVLWLRATHVIFAASRRRMNFMRWCHALRAELSAKR